MPLIWAKYRILYEIAKELLINQTYLRKMFKEETTITISEYLVKYRMEKAKELILHTDDKLAVIDEKVGYSDESIMEYLQEILHLSLVKSLQ